MASAMCSGRMVSSGVRSAIGRATFKMRSYARGVGPTRRLCRHVPIPERWHLDVDIDAVEEGPGDPAEIALDLSVGATALPLGLGQGSARTWGHSRRQHE